MFHCFGTSIWPLWHHVKTFYNKSNMICCWFISYQNHTCNKRLFSKLRTKNNLFMLETLTHKTHQYDKITMNLLYRTNRYSSAHNIRPEKQLFLTKTTPVKKVLWNRENLTLKGGTPGSNNRKLNRGTQRQFSENICSEDDLRSRIFGIFVAKSLACLPLLGFSNVKKMA